ncbi:hypothetical protein, partial [Klebsiella quasipneumoniae]|uniref:hypothetical protein n=1 Tax=Klebsiella quasipneumoniae TaxID=1463165 RepID=UPI001CFCF8EF
TLTAGGLFRPARVLYPGCRQKRPNRGAIIITYCLNIQYILLAKNGPRGRIKHRPLNLFQVLIDE